MLKFKKVRDLLPKEVRHIQVKLIGFPSDEYSQFKENFEEEAKRCLDNLVKSSMSEDNVENLIDGIEELIPNDGEGTTMNTFWKYLSYIVKVGAVKIVGL